MRNNFQKKFSRSFNAGKFEFFPGSMNIYKLNALRDCLNMREYAMIGEKYDHHDDEVCRRPSILDTNAFNMARKAFQKYNSEEFCKNDYWIAVPNDKY